ncbi:MAG: hypothetical protein PHZ00_02800 [Candidatus Peribacteraceae bacterium]|nr:hypothetical protein [Candidatus Peribacteraceae bacterium]
MRNTVFKWRFEIGIMLVLIGLTLLNVKPYGWNITALFHMDSYVASLDPPPENFVVLSVPGFDGEQYYQIAKHIPLLSTQEGRKTLRSLPPGVYAYQRILLPLTAFILSAGQERGLPYAFLGINLISLMLIFVLMRRLWNVPTLYALALALCPAAILGLHFNITEPLTLLLLTLFIGRFRNKETLDFTGSLLLTLILLSREVNVLLLGFVTVYLFWRRNWKALPHLILPAVIFCLWQLVLASIFGSAPFFMNTSTGQWPGNGVWTLVTGGYGGITRYSLSALSILFLLILPGIVWTTGTLQRERKIRFLSAGALCFLIVMLLLPREVFGSVTGVGRVVTPVYPFLLMEAMEKRSPAARGIASVILVLGLITAIGFALTIHPYTLAG